MIKIESDSADLRSHDFYTKRAIRKYGLHPARPGFIESNGCIEWDGRIQSNGYGSDGAGYLHRQAWEAIVGPIPEGYEIHHKCGNRRCAFVGHLACLTSQEHAMLDHKLTEVVVRKILRAVASGTKHREIAETFGIANSYVSLLKHGYRWTRVVSEFWQTLGLTPTRYGQPEPA